MEILIVLVYVIINRALVVVLTIVGVNVEEAHVKMLYVKLHVMVEEIVLMIAIMDVMRLHVKAIVLLLVLVGLHLLSVDVDLLLVRPQAERKHNTEKSSF